LLETISTTISRRLGTSSYNN